VRDNNPRTSAASAVNILKVTLFPLDGGVSTLLGFIKENPGKKTAEIRNALNLPQRTLERLLKQLRDEDKIEFRGAPKTGQCRQVDQAIHPVCRAA